MPSNLSTADPKHDLSQKLQELERELGEARRRESATAELLKLINRSSKDLQPVFETVARNAAALSGSLFANVFRFDRELLHFVASNSWTEEIQPAFRSRFPMPADASTVVGRLILNRDVERIEDALQDAQHDIQLAGAGGWRRLLGIPMLLEDRPVGAIVVGWADPGPIPKYQEELLQTFADHAVIAIENTRLFEELQARTKELQESLQQQTATADVLRVISRSTFDLQVVLNTLVQSAARLCDADLAIIRRRDDDIYPIAATHGLTQQQRDHLERYSIKPDRGSIFGRTVIEGCTVHIPDVLADPEFNRPQAPNRAKVRRFKWSCRSSPRTGPRRA